MTRTASRSSRRGLRARASSRPSAGASAPGPIRSSRASRVCPRPRCCRWGRATTPTTTIPATPPIAWTSTASGVASRSRSGRPSATPSASQRAPGRPPPAPEETQLRRSAEGGVAVPPHPGRPRPATAGHDAAQRAGELRNAPAGPLQPQRPEGQRLDLEVEILQVDPGSGDQPVGADVLGGAHLVELDDAALRRLEVADADRRGVRDPELDGVEAGAVVEVSRRPHPLGRPPVARAPGVIALPHAAQLDRLLAHPHGAADAAGDL